MQKENKDARQLDYTSLSDVWRELLGDSPAEVEDSQTSAEVVVPTLESDPWSALLCANDVEVVDLQKVHLHMSNQDVEQALQVMQEHPVQYHNETPGSHGL